jgi:phytoene dehydrogenase-like protein
LTRPGHEYRTGTTGGGGNNTLFCGASTRPGNGVPLVLIGAEQVAQKVIEKIKKKPKTASLLLS